MPASQALISLLAHAERERNGALSDAKRLEFEHRAAQRQAEQLLAYRADYEQRWSLNFGDGSGIAIVHCYRGFMDRLDAAIQAQQRVVASAAQHLADAQAQWQRHEIRVASIRKLLERRGNEARGAEQRREQKQQDEHAMRTAWLRGAGAALAAL